MIWLGRKEGCVPVVPWKPPELPAGTGLLGTGDSGASCVFETCWGVPVGQVKWEGEISLSSIFLLLATGWSPGTHSLLQSSDWNRVSHPGCQGTRCLAPAAMALGSMSMQVVGAGAALLLWDHPFSCLDTTRTSSFPQELPVTDGPWEGRCPRRSHDGFEQPPHHGRSSCCSFPNLDEVALLHVHRAGARSTQGLAVWV